MFGCDASARWATISAAVAVGGPVHFVLHCLEKELGQLGAGVVVDAGGVKIRDLLIEQALARPNVADAREQFVEIVGPDGAACLDAFIVQREPFDQQFAQAGRGPLTKRGSTRRADAVADGQNGVQVVVERAITLPIRGSCQVFLDN